MKKVNIFLIASFFLLTLATVAQDDTALRKFGSVNLGFHGAEFSYETPLTEKFIWENSLGLGMGSDVFSGASYTFALAYPVPYVKSEMKYVYNRKRRIAKNRSFLNNAGNYVALQAKYSLGNDRFRDLNRTLLTEVHWGLQRPLGDSFLFNFHVGLGVLKDYETGNAVVSPTVGINFGYILF